MGDYFLNYFKKSDKVNMKSIITLYGTKVFCPNEEMQISASAKTHILITSLVNTKRTETKFVLILFIKRTILLHLF